MTLVEVTIVMVLATLVVMGLIGFYISSQTVWLHGSSQALAQRDATLLVEAFSDTVRQYARAVVFDSPDGQHQGVALYVDGDPLARCRYWWSEQDSRVHYARGPGHSSGGSWLDESAPVVASEVTRFQLAASATVVEIRLLTVRSVEGDVVEMTGAAALNNRTGS
jgi:hypothetical protein